MDPVQSLRIQDRVRLVASSPLHRGVYETTILGIQSGKLRVALPQDQGKFVFIPVGTTVQLLTADGQPSTLWRVIDRQGGERRSLVLSPPTCPASEPFPLPRSRVLAVSSGKGGVGKSVLALNLALGLADLGRKVCLIDADLGTANLDVLLNLAPRYSLEDVVRGGRALPEVLVQGPGGIQILPGASAVEELADLAESHFRKLYSQLSELDTLADTLVIDTGAGLSRRVTSFLLAAGETILVTTPEPHAITDAYALLKVLMSHRHTAAIHLVVAMCKNHEEGSAVAEKMMFAARRFLDVDLDFLGAFPFDPAVPASVRQQRPLFLSYPHSRASQAIRSLAARLLRLQADPTLSSPLSRFLQRLREAGALARFRD